MVVRVTLVAHFEVVEDTFTWWADSPDAAGFYAAYPSLGELQREAEAALRWTLGTQDVETEWRTDGDVPEWAAFHVAANPSPGLNMATSRRVPVVRSQQNYSISI